MLDGSAKSLLNDDKVKEFYLGISSEGRKNFRDVLKETKKNKGLQSWIQLKIENLKLEIQY
mgnify:FL=1